MSISSKIFVSFTMAHLLIAAFSSSKSAYLRLGVRAFTLSSTPSRVALQSAVRPLVARTTDLPGRSLSSRAATPVDEDLDKALDDILGDALFEASNPADMEPGNHIKGSHPMPENLVAQDDPVDFSDPKFLSTSNPHWVQAGLSQAVIDILSGKGITRFTPVQGEAFGPVLAGRDVIGRSRTGTGKTLAFGMPGLTRIVKKHATNGNMDQNGRFRRGRLVSMIILCPTRELARQVQEELALIARPLGLFTEVFHGGVSYDPQARALRNGLDVLVGTPGRVIDHIQKGNLDLSECDIAVLDEADEMLNMGFADDVETILEGIGSANEQKTQCLLFSATTPPWVKQIGRQYQQDVISIDATADDTGARTAKTVRHMAIQFPPGPDSKRSLLEDIIAVEISKDANYESDDEDSDLEDNPIAAAHAAKKKKGNSAVQQKIFGKTIVFTETKREADELVSGSVFKSLTAQALHGDVGQKQRDATLNAFRAGAFNVLVATDVAARGIDIKDVDLVIQFSPPRDVDTYVHRSGRTGRAGQKGTSVLLFDPRQARDIVKIERELGHGFKFELAGPPSIEAALSAAARTSAIACKSIPEETAGYFMEAANALLEEAEPAEVVARCLAAISRRANEVQSRSLLTGELGLATVEMKNSQGRNVSPGDVMFTVSKLSRMSRREGDLSFDSDVGKIKSNADTGSAVFDMSVDDATKLIAFSKDIDAGGHSFSVLKEMEIERGRDFGKNFRQGGGGRYGNNRGGGYQNNRGGGYMQRDYRGGGGGGGRYQKGNNNYQGNRSRSNYENRRPRRDDGGQESGGGYRGRRSEGGGQRSGGGQRNGYQGRNNNNRYENTSSGGGGNSDGW
mmetsp:Transcript_21545/g.30003  ORF Transcript_21545/g.30003 Transcript_21545/m.30003 type:complete len:852 (+) Transcript_21545:217-2772(+)